MMVSVLCPSSIPFLRSFIRPLSQKLNKMLAIAGMRGDATSRFHNALLLGDISERIKVLESSGQTALAYATATTHGLADDAERLRGYLESAGLPIPELPGSSKAAAMLPPTPIYRNTANWPTVAVARAAFDPAAVAAMAAAASERAQDISGGQAAAAAAAAALVAAAAAAEKAASESALAASRAHGAGAASAAAGDDGEAEGGGWDDELDLGQDEDARKAAGGGAAAGADAGGNAWDDGLDLEVDEPSTGGRGSSSRTASFVPPAGGTSTPSYWVQNSTVAGDHVSAGSYETAVQLLNRQIGIVNFAPLKAAFSAAFQGARASTPTLPSAPAVAVFLTRNDRDAPPPKERTLPVVVASLASLQERVRSLFRAFQDGKFGECRDVLDALFSLIPLVVVFTKQEVAEVRRLRVGALQV
jgi:coatomer subunit alpha